VIVRDSRLERNGEEGLFARSGANVEVYDSVFVGNGACALWAEEESVRVSGASNEMRGNLMDLCGYVPASVRKPLAPQTASLTVRVPEDYATVQEALDAVPPGGTVVLGEGRFEGAVTLWKPVTLRGAGREETILPQTISVLAGVADVLLQDLGVNFSPEEGLLVYGGIALEGVDVSYNDGTGLVLYSPGTAELRNVRLQENDRRAALLFGSSRLRAEDSLFEGGRYPLLDLNEESSVEIARSVLRGSRRQGVYLADASSAVLREVEISGNGLGYALAGITVLEGSRLSLSQSRVVGNGGNGLEVVALFTRAVARATVEDSLLEGNGSSARCANEQYFCNGLVLAGNAELVLEDSALRGNADWGLAVEDEACGYGRSRFTGWAELRGENIFEGNNLSGNLEGMGNPGDHPYGDLPDGQICLPLPSAEDPQASSVPGPDSERPQEALPLFHGAANLLGGALPDDLPLLQHVQVIADAKGRLEALLRHQQAETLRLELEEELLRARHELRH